eukprot:CAMPEP_0196994856 /NCGR_PEP_ID=MMETSP1380-20130617/1083_1 /TAXON_ID=5936 /ORGANISM="Euplotes crassus, Strain CT5" /LENGTH=183 /DNA_ID=CAMNT_0042410347 /DNA_START=61 /DNA_END=612 /DNA_ORIENTATION=-
MKSQSNEICEPKKARITSQCSSTDLSTVTVKDAENEASETTIIEVEESEIHQKIFANKKTSAFCTKTSHNQSCLNGLPCMFMLKKMQEEAKEEPSQSEKKDDKRLSSYSLRKDVIYKVIFRTIRKFFINDFKKFSDNKQPNSEPSRDLISKIRSYVSAKFDCSQDHQQLEVLVLSIIDTKQRY